MHTYNIYIYIYIYELYFTFFLRDRLIFVIYSEQLLLEFIVQFSILPLPYCQERVSGWTNC